MPDCLLTDLTPYQPSAEKPWNRSRVQHLFRRASFGIPYGEIDSVLQLPPQETVDAIVDEAVNSIPLSQPGWSNWSISNYSDYTVESIDQTVEHVTMALQRMIDGGLREKLTLFFSGLLVTKRDVYECPAYLFQYHQILFDQCLGSYKELVRSVGLTPAMLVFLNGAQNSVAAPNENYARELFELFTLGQNQGYTQTDIEEAARALSGYTDQAEECSAINFNSGDFDSGSKSIFGQQGNWTYDDLIDILFEQRSDQIAAYLSSRLYEFFVSSEPNVAIIDQLAQTLINNDFNVLTVVEEILRSELFFDDDAIGIRVKSPLDISIQYWKELQLTYDNQTLTTLFSSCSDLGLALFDPPDVSGYATGLQWINSSTLAGRWGMMLNFLDESLQTDPEELRHFAQAVVPDQSHWTDPVMISRKIVDFFIIRGLNHAAEYDTATIVFKADVPQNYYDLLEWNLGFFPSAPEQVHLLLKHIAKLPDFQLN